MMNKPSNDQPRWAIIGASQIAKNWVAPAILAAGSQILAVQSRSQQRAEQFAKEFGAAGTDSLESILGDKRIEAVYVATENERHHEIVMALAKAGKHVLCEKPLALRVDDAVEMASTCDRLGVILATNHHLRGGIAHATIRDLVQRGDIGKPLSAVAHYCEYLPAELQTWRTHSAEAGGVILDLFTHNIDCLRFVLGEEPVEVTSMSAVSLIGHNGVEDQSQSLVRFASGLLAHTHESHALAHYETGIEVHGTEGALYGRGIMDERPVGRLFIRRGSTETEVPLQHRNLYGETIAAFNRSVRGQGRPLATGWDGVKSLVAAMSVKKSSSEGGLVKIPNFGHQ
jgi:1,5-anhydro-D-fructose reductase (1,5-anhydro-D-mannitol-forming)